MALGAAIGWGAFILPFDWMIASGMAGSLIGLFIGGLMITIIAFSYGYTIRALPVTGGGVVFAMVSLGRLHSFIAGWALTLGYAGIVALNASAVTLVFRVTFPKLLQRVPLYEIAGWTIYLPEIVVAALFITIFALLNWRGSALSGRFQLWAVILMLASVVAILGSLLVIYFIERPTLPPAVPQDTSVITSVLVMVAFAPWAYVGFDSIPQLAGEFNFSAKKALGLLLWGVSAATFIYMAMMVSTVIAVNTDHARFEESAWPTGEAIADMMGPIGLVMMVVAVTMGVLTGLNGFFAASSRVVYSLGNADLVPTTLGHIDSKYRTPRNAVIFIAVICLLTPFLGRAALSWIVDMTSVGITFAYFYTCFCAWKIARTGRVDGMESSVPKSKIHEILGLIGCVLAICFLALLIVPGSPGVLAAPAYVALVVWVVLGILFYLAQRKKLEGIPEDVTLNKLISLK